MFEVVVRARARARPSNFYSCLKLLLGPGLGHLNFYSCLKLLRPMPGLGLSNFYSCLKLLLGPGLGLGHLTFVHV